MPVIMLTSRGQDKHREHALSVGVNAFLIKPYSDQNLLDTVRAAARGDKDLGKPSQTRMQAPARTVDLAVDLS